MDERVFGLAGAVMAIVLALSLLAVGPARGAVAIAHAPPSLEVSARVAGIDIVLKL